MATTASQTKKSTTKKPASRGSSSGKAGGSRQAKTPPQPEKRPIRREVLGGIFLLLGLVVIFRDNNPTFSIWHWFARLFFGRKNP